MRISTILHPRRAIVAGLLATLAACGGDDLVLPEDSIPTTIVPLKGNEQVGTVGLPVPDSITVRVLDATNRPVQGQQVVFTVMAGGGSVTPGTAVTNADGVAQALWTLGVTAGTQRVEAKAMGGGAPDDLAVVFTATAGASRASNIAKVSGDAQSDIAGSTLNDSLVVRTTDADGNPVGGVTVTWSVSGGGTTSAATTVTGADGRTGVRRTLGPVAGTQNTTATAAGLAGSPVTFTATARVGTAGRLVIVQQPSTNVGSGVQFPQQPLVQIQDVNGNNVPAVGRAVTAEIVSGPVGATLIGSATVATNAAGLATFTNLGISGPAGDYTLNFTGPELQGTTSATISVGAGAASRLAFVSQPSNTTAGGTIPTVSVAIRDAFGQTVTSATNAVTISLGSNPGSGTLSGTRTVNAVNGVATFTNLSINRAGAGYTLVASASGLTDATSNAFNVTGGSASTISANSSVAATTTAGATVTPAPSVRVVDANGNPISGVAVTFAAGASGGTVTGGTTTTNSDGIATVGSWTIGSAAGTVYELRATASGLAGSPVVFSTTAASGSASRLAIVTQPGTPVQSGAAFNPQPAVRLTDAAGNPVNTSGIAVTASVSGSPAGVTLTNATAATSAGVATFSGLTVTGPAGTYTLVFSSPGLTSVTSASFTIPPGAPANATSTLTVAPASVPAGGSVTETLTLKDAAGNPIPGATITFTSTLAPAGGTAVTNASGLAARTFTATPAGTYNISAQVTSGAAALPTPETATLTVTP